MNNENNIEIVVARYNEDLLWLEREPFNKYPNIIYNKGKGEINKFPKTMQVLQLENTGREYGTYLHHIINNYDNLANITIFLPGSTDNLHKEKKANHLVSEIEKHQDTVFIGAHHENIYKDLYYFYLNSYGGSDIRNDINQVLTPASIRPFGKWYENKFQQLRTQKLSYQGIVAISKRDVLQEPISYYQSFLDELSVSSNPEVGHYIERSWQAIFKKAVNPISLTSIDYDNPTNIINKPRFTRMKMHFT